MVFAHMHAACARACKAGVATYLICHLCADDTTMMHPVPNYIWMVIGLGTATALANALSLCGTCCRSTSV